MKFFIFIILNLLIIINSQAALFQFDADESLLVNVNNQPAFIFDDTGASVYIDLQTYKIHQGNQYRCSNANIDFDTDVYWHFLTGDKKPHVSFTFSASKPGELYVYENSNINTNGTQVACGNNDRTSTNTPLSKAFILPDIYDNGDILLTEIVGTDGNNPQGGIGGNRSAGREFVLKQNTSYLIRFDPQTTGNRASVSLEFCENGE